MAAVGEPLSLAKGKNISMKIILIFNVGWIFYNVVKMYCSLYFLIAIKHCLNSNGCNIL